MKKVSGDLSDKYEKLVAFVKKLQNTPSFSISTLWYFSKEAAAILKEIEET